MEPETRQKDKVTQLPEHRVTRRQHYLSIKGLLDTNVFQHQKPSRWYLHSEVSSEDTVTSAQGARGLSRVRPVNIITLNSSCR